jgi:hypothetical protein
MGNGNGILQAAVGDDLWIAFHTPMPPVTAAQDRSVKRERASGLRQGGARMVDCQALYVPTRPVPDPKLPSPTETNGVSRGGVGRVWASRD